MARSSSGEEMAAVLKDLERSGETAAAFGRRHGIKPQKLSYWKRRLSAEPRVKRVRTRSATPRLLPVEFVAASAAAAALEIHLPGGERIVFPQGGSPAALRAVLAVLRERC
jgi:hypothetical protein